MKKIITILTSILAIPIVAFAQASSGGALGGTDRILTSAKGIISTLLIPIVFTLALLLFFWGIAKFIWQEGQGKEDGKKIMIWGVIALFVASSVWGLVRFLQGEFLGGTVETNMQIPGFGNGGGSVNERPPGIPYIF